MESDRKCKLFSQMYVLHSDRNVSMVLVDLSNTVRSVTLRLLWLLADEPDVMVVSQVV